MLLIKASFFVCCTLFMGTFAAVCQVRRSQLGLKNWAGEVLDGQDACLADLGQASEHFTSL